MMIIIICEHMATIINNAKIEKNKKRIEQDNFKMIKV
jgi:hypothetical protein